eukprot:TRINITY_DN112099_c0_g1_i1.p1 TRINITY_DN112099_c0_g1~~TRINITY_DN112099_c0_g1_i1.p1  ORF type:complete len:286 (-),score=37.11 TRINITY_DN112099_c0_g1_i1:110-967(-)
MLQRRHALLPKIICRAQAVTIALRLWYGWLQASRFGQSAASFMVTPAQKTASRGYALQRQTRKCRLQSRAFPDATWIDMLRHEIPDRVLSLGQLGPVYFGVAFVLSAGILLPITPLMLSAGLLFGLPLGIGITFLAVCTSAGVNFLLSRTLFRSQVQKAVERDESLSRISAAVECEGFSIILLLRLSPLLPFAASSYALGLTKVPFLEYLLATALGYAPWIVVLVSSSTVFGGIQDDDAAVPEYYYVLGALLTVFFVKLAADIAGKAIDEAIDASVESCAVPKEQ